MEWKGRRQSDNVEDRRGQGGQSRGNSPFGRGGFSFPTGGGGMRSGGGIGSIVVFIVVAIVLYFMGIDVTQLLDGGGVQTSSSRNEQSDRTTTTPRTAAENEMKAFVSTVLAETEDTWNGIFEANGQRYEEPRLVMFSGAIPSACGQASAASGPFYCPSDRKIYLDTAFFNELSQRFNASGDFADAYVVAHEVGHHVQNLLGTLPKFNQARQGMTETEANRMSVRVELQADCFAGIWGKFTQQKGILEQGDLEEALNAATQIGDDTLQKRSQGYVVPESFNHGTSAQRASWFRRGFESGKVDVCDTFNANI